MYFIEYLAMIYIMGIMIEYLARILMVNIMDSMGCLMVSRNFNSPLKIGILGSHIPFNISIGNFNVVSNGI